MGDCVDEPNQLQSPRERATASQSTTRCGVPARAQFGGGGEGGGGWGGGGGGSHGTRLAYAGGKEHFASEKKVGKKAGSPTWTWPLISYRLSARKLEKKTSALAERRQGGRAGIIREKRKR